MPVFRKRFGQHFLRDQQVITKLLAIINPLPTEHLVEIGPGDGALTFPLLEKVKQLEVIEFDRDLIPVLKKKSNNQAALKIIQADALTFDFNQLVKANEMLRIVGNLPYNISTPLIFHLLKFADVISDMHFMLQKEVVDRITAKNGGHEYGRLSIMVQYHCAAIPLFEVNQDAFYPPPAVLSKIIKLVPYKNPPFKALNYSLFSNLVKTAFGARRKILRNSLKNIISDALWPKISIDANLRPEQLTIEDYVNLSNFLNEQG